MEDRQKGVEIGWAIEAKLQERGFENQGHFDHPSFVWSRHTDRAAKAWPQWGGYSILLHEYGTLDLELRLESPPSHRAWEGRLTGKEEYRFREQVLKKATCEIEAWLAAQKYRIVESHEDTWNHEKDYRIRVAESLESIQSGVAALDKIPSIVSEASSVHAKMEEAYSRLDEKLKPVSISVEELYR